MDVSDRAAFTTPSGDHCVTTARRVTASVVPHGPAAARLDGHARSVVTGQGGDVTEVEVSTVVTRRHLEVHGAVTVNGETVFSRAWIRGAAESRLVVDQHASTPPPLRVDNAAVNDLVGGDDGRDRDEDLHLDDDPGAR